MSLGLGDINKRRRPNVKTKAETSAKQDSAKETSTKKSASSKTQRTTRSRTARPWSSTGLHRATKNRPRLNFSESVMTEEWLSEHISWLSWEELKQNSLLLKVNEYLSEMEGRLRESVRHPIKALRSFLKSK